MKVIGDSTDSNKSQGWPVLYQTAKMMAFEHGNAPFSLVVIENDRMSVLIFLQLPTFLAGFTGLGLADPAAKDASEFAQSRNNLQNLSEKEENVRSRYATW